MNRKVSAMFGTLLILLGALFLLANVVFQTAGVWVWQTWPLLIVAGGALFLLAPLFYRREKWTGVFFIPGMPILTVGLLLLASSMGNLWGIWTWGWALVILAVAVGLALAGLATRIYWIGLPSIILCGTGLILGYCAVTGDWDAWIWLWGLEVAVIGAMILAVGYLAHNPVVRTVGWSFIGFGAFAATTMMALAGLNSRLMAFGSAGVLILGGIALIAGGLLSGRQLPPPSESNSPAR
jgi:hypothetical protein